MKRSIVVLLLAATLVGIIAAPSSAVVWNLRAELTGSQVVPPANTNAFGTLRGTYDDVTKTISLTIVVTGIRKNDILSSQIHLGAPGVNGPPIIQIGGSAAYNEVNGRLERVLINVPFPTAREADLLSGNTYFDIHTVQYPAPQFAELRGQILATPIPEPATLVSMGIGLGALALYRRRQRN